MEKMEQSKQERNLKLWNDGKQASNKFFINAMKENKQEMERNVKNGMKENNQNMKYKKLTLKRKNKFKKSN